MSLTPAQLARKRARKNLKRKNKQYDPTATQRRLLKQQASVENLTLTL